MNYNDKNVATMKKITLIAAFVSLMVSACSIYHPQAVDMPLINHKGDVRVEADMSMSAWLAPDAVNMNVTGSTGITDWLAGQLHFNYGGDNAYMQVAPGAYLNLGENSVLEGYAGFGYGGVWRNADGTSSRKDGESSSSSSYAYSGRYMLPFVQANIGWHDVGAAHFGFAFGLKAGAYMPDFEYNEFNANGEAIAHRYEHYTRGNLLLEPQVQLSLGGEHVRWVSRLGFAWLSDVSAGEGSTTFMNDWFTVGTGIQLSF